jgi:hypothetical protein
MGTTAKLASRSSEILLLALLLVIVGFTRVYFGGPEGVMVVWKGEFGYNDTFVNLDDFYKIPKKEAAAQHAQVLYQLEEMGLTHP